MTILEIIQLSLVALQATLGQLTKAAAPVEVISEVEAAIASLVGVQQKIVDLNELESLRTSKVW